MNLKIEEVKKNAHNSIGTELADEDLICIQGLCHQIIDLNEYKNQVTEYIRIRMIAIAPNLTEMLGESVASQLIAHAGSLSKLAKVASSTVQIMGAEKAFFQAVKDQKPTPKYGFMYHASLVVQSDSSFKGKIARSLAAKSILSARVDAYCDEPNFAASIGITDKNRIEDQIRVFSKQATKVQPSRSKIKVIKTDPILDFTAKRVVAETGEHQKKRKKHHTAEEKEKAKAKQ